MIASRVESIPSRIARVAKGLPDQTAIVDESGPLTYGELDRSSALLSARLQATGISREHCVAVVLDRSAKFVAAALAVMKSGAAYIPLDPATPMQRIRAILSDAEAAAVITDSAHAGTLPTGAWGLIDVGQVGDSPTEDFTNRDIEASDLAYVIYTSGSTGLPKGVEITHGSLFNLVEWHHEAFGVTAADRASQLASLGFDAAVWEIWSHLTVGASLHIADEITRRSPEALHDWIVREKITISFVPTSLAERLMRMDWPADTALRVLLTGGDVLRQRPAADVPFIVVNNYGPTECTVVATSGIVDPDGCDDGAPSIGRPIANAAVLILDDALRPLAPGETGELCIGGSPVGRGYRNQPALNHSQFITYFTASGEPLRIYRTRDRARFLKNGEIEFLGRLDDQVKIRGQRVELGEITATLNRFEGVAASMAAVREVGSAGPTLVAYVVPEGSARLTASVLRDFISASLPEYAVPAIFVSISDLPVLSNGKLNPAGLPPPDAHNLIPNTEIAPNGHRVIDDDGVPHKVSALVTSMLGRPLDPDENFFLAGGHSMLGVELVAKLRDAFGVQLSLRQLFKAPTTAALAAEISLQTKAR